MTDTVAPEPTPEQAALMARVRRMMLIAGLTSALAVAVVLIAVGYRLYRGEGSPASATTDIIATVPKGARIIDCTGKFIIPGLVDGFAGMNSQAEANANLYMGVTTVVASSDGHRGHVDLGSNPTPHIYLLDSIGTTDDWSLLIGHPGWTGKLRQTGRALELGLEDTARQLTDTAGSRGG